ncbi:MAG: hypothetical protein RIQ81_836 [Pseudomonadota bacterium]
MKFPSNRQMFAALLKPVTTISALLLGGNGLASPPPQRAEDKIANAEFRVWTSDDDNLPALEREIARKIQIAPDSSYGHFLLSHVYLRMFANNPQDTESLRVSGELATQALELDPEAEYGYVAMADVLEALGQTNKAIAVLREGQKRTDGWRIKFTQARLSADRSNAETTSELLVSAIKTQGSLQRVIAPYMVILAQTDGNSPAIVESMLARWHEQFPEAGFDDSLASFLAEKGDHEKAHRIYQSIHQFQSTAKKSNKWLANPEALFSDSLLCYRKLDKSKVAIRQLQALRDAIRSGRIPGRDMSAKLPALVDIHLAAAQLRMKNHKEAHSLISEALAKVPDQGPAVEFLFKEYRNAGAFRELIQLFADLVDSGTINGSSRNVHLGMIHAFMAEVFSEKIGNQFEAENYYRRAIALEPTRSEYYNGLGLALYRRSDMKAALGEFTKAAEIDPGDASARYNEACALALLGRQEEALVSLREAIQLEPRLSEQARIDKDFASISASNGFQEILASETVMEEGVSTAWSPEP